MGVGFKIVLVARVFVACQFQQERFEFTIVTRKVLLHFYNRRARDPGEGKGEVLFFSLLI